MCQVPKGVQSSRKFWRLYDLQADMSESKNVINKHPGVASRLRAEFLRWFEDVTKGVKYAPIPIPLGHLAEPTVEIQASWAKWQGDNVKYVFRGYDWDTIEGWKAAGENATWNLDVRRAGRYAVELSYGRSARGGGVLSISMGESQIRVTPPPTPTADVFERIKIGTLEIPKGSAVLKAEVVEGMGTEVLRLNRLFLTRIESK